MHCQFGASISNETVLFGVSSVHCLFAIHFATFNCVLTIVFRCFQLQQSSLINSFTPHNASVMFAHQSNISVQLQLLNSHFVWFFAVFTSSFDDCQFNQMNVPIHSNVASQLCFWLHWLITIFNSLTQCPNVCLFQFSQWFFSRFIAFKCFQWFFSGFTQLSQFNT